MIHETPRVIEDPHNYEARANIMWAGMLAHNNVCGVGRVQDWASHHIEHELSALYDVTHGAGLAVIAPAWMRHVLRINPHKLVQFAERVWDVLPQAESGSGTDEETALLGIEKFEAFLKSIGMPLSFAEIGADAKDIDRLTEKLLAGKETEGNYVKLKAEDVKCIYRSVCED